MDTRILVLVLAVAAPACNAITKDLLGPGSGGSDAAVPPDDSAGSGDGSVIGPTDMLMVDYEFEDGTGAMATDSARGLSATLSNPAMWTANGRNGKAIAMVAAIPANQYVSLPDGILTTTNDFTISAWVKLSSNPIWARIYDIGNGLPDPANRFMYLTLNGFAAGHHDRRRRARRLVRWHAEQRIGRRYLHVRAGQRVEAHRGDRLGGPAQALHRRLPGGDARQRSGDRAAARWSRSRPSRGSASRGSIATPGSPGRSTSSASTAAY